MTIQDEFIVLLSKIKKENISLETRLEIDKILGVTKTGERVYHPVFGLGTFQYNEGEYWVRCNFDDYNNDGYRRNPIRVARRKLISIAYLINKEKK